MFFDGNNFKIMETGVNLAWMKQQISTQNISNSETPGYKSKSLSFDTVLRQASNGRDGKEVNSIDVKVNTSDEVSLRPDGNNVDAETEYIALYKAYAQYSTLLNKVNSEFDKYNYVLNSNM